MLAATADRHFLYPRALFYLVEKWAGVGKEYAAASLRAKADTSGG